jgi:hypothetical protein
MPRLQVQVRSLSTHTHTHERMPSLLLTCHHLALANTSTSIMASDALDLLDHLKWDKVL